MSSDAALPSSSAPRQPTWSFKIQNFSTPQTFAAKSDAESRRQQTTISPGQVTTSSLPTQNTLHDAYDKRRRTQLVRKRRRLNKEEEEMKNEIAASVSTNMQIDCLLTLYPDAETHFENEMDVVQRLLPYHIYQHPQHDLDAMRGLKGKAKASETDLLREEIKEAKFALECHKRLRSLEQRMKRARLKPGRCTIPLDQAILVERMMLEMEHTDKSALEQELSNARSELDKILRTQRIAKATANRTTSTMSIAATVNGTNSTTPYYGYTSPTFSATSTPSYSNYYSSYTYPYTQSFISGAGYAASAKGGSSSIPGVSSFQTGATTQATVPLSSSSVNQASTTSASTTAPAHPPPVAIPLQLPVTSLPALQSLGILPVPKTSLPAEPNPQPAAVLLGSSNNGTMLSLEINAALLQPPQMSGLAILLSSLVKMSGGPTSSAQSTGQKQSIAASNVAQANSSSGSAASAASGASANSEKAS